MLSNALSHHISQHFHFIFPFKNRALSFKVPRTGRWRRLTSGVVQYDPEFPFLQNENHCSATCNVCYRPDIERRIIQYGESDERNGRKRRC